MGDFFAWMECSLHQVGNILLFHLLLGLQWLKEGGRNGKTGSISSELKGTKLTGMWWPFHHVKACLTMFCFYLLLGYKLANGFQWGCWAG